MFTDPITGNSLTGNGVLTADNPEGLQLDSLEVRVPNAQLGAIGVSNVDFRYRSDYDSFNGQATVDVGPFGNISGTVDFVHGTFNGATLQYDAGAGPGIDLCGPIPIFLTQLGGGFTIDPAVIAGNATIAGGPNLFGCPLFSISGSMTALFDTPPPIGGFALGITAQGPPRMRAGVQRAPVPRRGRLHRRRRRN